MSAEADAPVERILVIAIDRLGDTLQSCGALHALRQRCPAARIDLLAVENYASALEGSPFHDRYLGLSADDVLAYGRVAEAALAGEQVSNDGLAELVEVLCGERYDLVVNLVTSTLGAWLTTVAGPRFRAGLFVGADRSLLVEGPSHRYFVALLDFREENPFNLVDLFRGSVAEPHETLTPKMHVATVPVILPGGPQTVALNPGASHADRRWPLSSFAALADALTGEGLQVFLVGGPADASLCEAVQRASTSKPVIYTSLTVAEMAGWFKTMGCIVANDTGAMHIASAAGAKAVGIYGGFSRYRETAPFGAGHLLLEGDSLGAVDVASVKEAVLVQLGTRPVAEAVAHWRAMGVEAAQSHVDDDRVGCLGGLRYEVLADRAGDGEDARIHRIIRRLALCTFRRTWLGAPVEPRELVEAIAGIDDADLRSDLAAAHERWAESLDTTADRWASLAAAEQVVDGQVSVLLKVEAMNVQQIAGAGTLLLSKLLEWDLKMIPFEDLDSFVAARCHELRAMATLARAWSSALAPTSSPSA